MLQFLIGTATVNINWLTAPLLGITVFNSPPLFFIAVPVLMFAAVYGFRIRKDIVLFLLAITILGVGSALMHGFTDSHKRQILAFGVSAIVWVFLYQMAAEKDIFTMTNTKVILGIYFTAMVMILTELYVFQTANVSCVLSNIFSGYSGPACGIADLSGRPRLAYFSPEPSSAACAIGASIMPLVCARAAAEKSAAAFVMFGLTAIVLYYAEGMTGQLILLFSLGFIFFPRIATYGVPCILAVAIIAVASLARLLEDRTELINFLLTTFGGIYSRIDEGFASGSYISRLGTYFVGARTFLDAPVFGQGFGGSGANFFSLANQGLDVAFTPDQQSMLNGGESVFNAQMVVRIPAELGAVGSAFVLFYAWKALKLAGRARARLSRFDYYTYLYAAGVMMVTFITNSEYALPTISAFVVILAQTRRKLGEMSRVPATARVAKDGPEPLAVTA